MIQWHRIISSILLFSAIFLGFNDAADPPYRKIVNMEQHRVMPDVIPESPRSIMEVRFAGNTHAHLGNELTPTQVKNAPIVFWNSEPGALYTLCMTDPDAPSRKDPTMREWLHWLIVNIPAGNSFDLDITPGEVIAEYIGSGPGEGTGLHRYVVLVYKQPGKLTVDEPRLTNSSADGRANFKIAKFAEKYKLGTPAGGNFYLAKYDAYVPILLKQLGM